MLYNRLLVRFDGKNYNVYDAPVLFNYMCAENRFKEVETALGDTQEKDIGWPIELLEMIPEI